MESFTSDPSKTINKTYDPYRKIRQERHNYKDPNGYYECPFHGCIETNMKEHTWFTHLSAHKSFHGPMKKIKEKYRKV